MNDSWLRDGWLRECYGECAVYAMGMGTDIYVSRFIADADWSFRRPTLNALMDIFHKNPLEIRPCSEFEDEIVWTLEEHGCFTLKSTYQLMNNLSNQELK